MCLRPLRNRGGRHLKTFFYHEIFQANRNIQRIIFLKHVSTIHLGQILIFVISASPVSKKWTTTDS